jgi:hypothetical protein
MIINKKKRKEINPYSFRLAYEGIPRKMMKNVKIQIKELFDVKSDKAFYERMAGVIEPKISEAKNLELLFEDYGVTLVWGEVENI